MINLEHLQEITNNNHLLLKDILSEFISSTTIDIEHLQKAIDEKNTYKIKQLAHRIKGAAAVIGAIQLQKLAHNIENTHKEVTHTFIEKLQLCFQQTKSAIDLERNS